MTHAGGGSVYRDEEPGLDRGGGPRTTRRPLSGLAELAREMLLELARAARSP